MNNNKLKQIVVSSLIALTGASCTTAPMENNQQGGVNGVPHSHNGKNHSHPLPSTGLQHTHSAGQTQTRAYDVGTGNFGSNSGSSSSDSSRDDRNYNDVASSNSSNDSAGSDSDYYTVKPKDTVFEVMRQTGAYWKDIIRLNDLKAPQYEIQPGQRLKLPVERNS